MAIGAVSASDEPRLNVSTVSSLGRAVKSGELLRIKIGLALKQFGDGGRSHTAGVADRDMVEFLKATCLVAEASIPLLVSALDRSSKLGPTDPVANGVCEYLKAQMESEREHATWVAEDLIAAGVRKDELQILRPTTALARLVGSQYYFIEHTHPVSLLGYIALLVSSLPSPEVVRDVRNRSALPAAAFRTWLEHAEIDRDHSAEIYQLLDNLPLSSWHDELVGHNALQSAELLGDILQVA